MDLLAQMATFVSIVEGKSLSAAARAQRLSLPAPSALHELALSGAGVAYLPDWVVADAVKRGALRRVLPEWSSPPISACAIHRAELRGAARLRVFLDALPKHGAEPSRH